MPRKILSVSEALANPVRREIVSYLIRFKALPTVELKKMLGINNSNLVNHLMILSRVGVIKVRKIHRRTYVSLNDEVLLNRVPRAALRP
ncbi:MAG: hypothetical protein DRJ56_01520 [Thermoprotei archaeon]|nr:MAG: hypothetical protein DRJ56_01520 [Thermoprotei archaeon]